MEAYYFISIPFSTRETLLQNPQFNRLRQKVVPMSNRDDLLKELGEMVATVAHEIRNPLGGIRGFASLLHRDLAGQPEQQEMAQHIIEGADNLSRFVTHVLNYARPTEVHLAPVDLNQLIEELRHHVEADPTLDSRITFTCHLAPSPVKALADAQLLQSALLNLIVNAIQAMPEGGKLALSVKQKNQQPLLQVSDTGVGISPENMPKLFSPLFTTRPSGNGFGLAEVKKIIQAHGGTIDVQSEVGKGTLFTLKLKGVA
jgi:signal transduction histidine kinase